MQDSETLKPHKANSIQNYICIIHAKKETTVWNLLALPLTSMIAVSAGGFVNANMPFLLRDENYFNFQFSEVGDRTGTALFWAYLASTLVTPFLGYVYDTVGRFWFMIPAMFAMSIFMAILPYTAPSFGALIVMRAAIAIVVNVISVNPLIIDYVKNKSRGLVVSLTSIGFVMGELVMIIMFSMTRSLGMAG
mmetsp:Transcript_17153/g.23131  ORF Transcript_17153/g.23131 Transcript_17153/m.23131 type:complete len:192 (+) Transcript_17153:106-681(+)